MTHGVRNVAVAIAALAVAGCASMTWVGETTTDAVGDNIVRSGTQGPGEGTAGSASTGAAATGAAAAATGPGPAAAGPAAGGGHGGGHSK
jgi:hypothetical protein